MDCGRDFRCLLLDSEVLLLRRSLAHPYSSFRVSGVLNFLEDPAVIVEIDCRRGVDGQVLICSLQLDVFLNRSFVEG